MNIRDMAVISLGIYYKEYGIKKAIDSLKNNLKDGVETTMSLALELYGVIDSERDKRIILEFIQECLNILKSKIK